MNNKYILGSLCSIAPVLLNKETHTWIINSIRPKHTNIFLTDSLTLNSNFQIQQKPNTVISFILTNVIDNKKINFDLFKDKKCLCLSILSKIWFLNSIFLRYNHKKGLKLLKVNSKLKSYMSYSLNIEDYTHKYTKIILYEFLKDINKIMTQSNKCIFDYQIQTFSKILHAILNINPNKILVKKVDNILTNHTLFMDTFYKYIKNTNYYVNLGELFKDV